MRIALTVVIGLLVFSGSASASTLSITMARPDQPDPSHAPGSYVSLHVSKSGRGRLAHDRKRTVVIDYFPAGGPLLTLGRFTLLRPR